MNILSILGFTIPLLAIAANIWVGFAPQRRAERLGRFWLELNWFTKPKGVIKRAQMLVDYPMVLWFLPYSIPIFSVLVLVPYCILWGSFATLAQFLFLYGVPRVIYFGFWKKPPVTFEMWMLIVSAKKVASNCPQDDATKFLYGLARNSVPEVRIAAVNGFMELDPVIGLDALGRMLGDPSREVMYAAKDAFAALNAIASGKKAVKLQALARLIQEHKSWKLRSTVSGINRSQVRNNLRITGTQLDDIIYSQLPQRLAFPHVYCERCLARATREEYDEWWWVHCRICGEADGLLLNVATVIGQLGGEAEMKLEDGRMVLPVWNEDRKSATAADLDVLEIHGGQPINYDWAISAVVQAMQHRSEPGQVQLRMLQPPALATNTQMLLQSAFPEQKPIAPPQ